MKTIGRRQSGEWRIARRMAKGEGRAENRLLQTLPAIRSSPSTTSLLFLLPLMLCLVGLVFLASVSIGEILKPDAPPISPLEPFRPVIQQACWVLLGLAIMVLLSRIPPSFHQASAWVWLALLSLTLIALWKVPGLGVERNGAVRWIEFSLPLLGRVGVQPSEMF
ncbi:MAG: FtsW/RodA/SpoVE family cell cycle protein, partial [Fimbriimonadales bacterium]|nr:FtsW/RodA/SpoVE family cell cycle protein [Fimbriimonadales bacterium]